MKASKLDCFVSLVRHFKNRSNIGDYLILYSENIHFPVINKIKKLSKLKDTDNIQHKIHEELVFYIFSKALEKKQEKWIHFFTQEHLNSFDMQKFVQSLIFQRQIDSYNTLKKYLPNFSNFLPDNPIESLYVEGKLKDSTLLTEIEHDQTLHTTRTIRNYQKNHSNVLAFIQDFSKYDKKLDITYLFNYVSVDDFKSFIDNYSNHIEWEDDKTSVAIKILDLKKNEQLMRSYNDQYILSEDNLTKFKHILPKINILKENEQGENILTKALGNHDITLFKHLLEHYNFELQWKEPKVIKINSQNIKASLSSYQDIINCVFNESEKKFLLDYFSSFTEKKYLTKIINQRNALEDNLKKVNKI
jgi:hypothetical protein